MQFHCIKVRYSIEPKDRIYVEGYGFLSLTKKMGTHIIHKYGQKRLYSTNKSITDAMKTASKRAIQKTREATGDLIGNKIADKITSVSKKSSKKSHSEELHSQNEAELEVPIERYISPEKRQQIIDEIIFV